MNAIISTWLSQQGVSAQYLPALTELSGAFVIILIAALSYYLAKYEVLKIQPVDMFPQTTHIENVALLRLK